MSEVVAVDIGGTHARFAIAHIGRGRVAHLEDAVTLKAAEHANLNAAWRAFEREAGRPLPRAAAIAVAAPVTGDAIKLTNNPWLIRPASLGEELGIDAQILINDFEAVGHAVACAAPEHFLHLCGPERPLGDGVISVVGPGTGLGVAWVCRDRQGYRVQATEGGHADYAPLDPVEDALVSRLRARYRRVSIERVVSGRGLAKIYETLATIEGRTAPAPDERALWALALSGSDSDARAALDRFCMALGSVAGDIALAQGGFAGVVIAGGLGLRLKDLLPHSGFAERFRAKGRFEALMASIPVKLITHPQPGLLGAAAAFAKDNP